MRFFKKIKDKIFHKKKEEPVDDFDQAIDEERLVNIMLDSIYVQDEPAIVTVDNHFENGGMKHEIVENPKIPDFKKFFIEKPKKTRLVKEERDFPYLLGEIQINQMANFSRHFMADLMSKKDKIENTEKELYMYYEEYHPKLALIIRDEIQRIRHQKINKEPIISRYNIPDIERVASYIPEFKLSNKIQAAINIYSSDEFKQMAGKYETGWYMTPIAFEMLNMAIPAAKLIGNMLYHEDIDNIQELNYSQFQELKNYCQEDLLNKVIIEIARCRKNDGFQDIISDHGLQQTIYTQEQLPVP